MKRLGLALGLALALVLPAHAMKLNILKGTTCADTTPRPCLVDVFMQDSSSTVGAGLTGLTSGSAGLVCYRARSDDGNAGGTQITLSAGTKGTWSSGGFVEKDATNMPGVYEIGLPTTAVATGSNFVLVMCKGATNLAPMVLEIALTNYDPQDSVRLGLTALPNAAAGANTGLPVVGTQVPNATAGASGGLLISGSNSGTTTLGALTVTGATTHTGNVSMAAGLTVTQSTLNGAGVSLTGNGTGQGLLVTGGATGPGAKFVGGGTSGDGIDVTTTSGDGLAITPTAGSGIVATGNGTSKHGIVATGGTAGTSDGIKGVAGTGGVDIRGNLTGNVTGNLSGSAGSVTGAVGSVTAGVTVTTNNDKTGYSLTQAFPTNFSALAITAGGAVTVGTNSDKTGYSLTQAFPTNFSSLSIDASGNVKIQAYLKKNVAATKFPFIMTDSTTHAPKTGLTPACTRSIDGAAAGAGTLANIAETDNGGYVLDFGAGDLNGNTVKLRCTAAASDDTLVTIYTFP